MGLKNKIKKNTFSLQKLGNEKILQIW